MDGDVHLWYLGEERDALLAAIFAAGGHVELGSPAQPARLEVGGKPEVLHKGRRIREAQYQQYIGAQGKQQGGKQDAER
jgi:hypothetical protein